VQCKLSGFKGSLCDQLWGKSVNKPTKELHSAMALSFTRFPQDTSKAMHPCFGEAARATIGALWSKLSNDV